MASNLRQQGELIVSEAPLSTAAERLRSRGGRD
jgi:hypothetical protein